MISSESIGAIAKAVGFSCISATVFLVACGAELDQPLSVDTNNAEIIGGFPIRSSRFDAVGTLSLPIPTSSVSVGASEAERVLFLAGKIAQNPRLSELIDPEYKIELQDTHIPFCSGTLISSTVVLTAKHCVEFLFPDTGFTIGFDGRRPVKYVRIREVVVENTIGGGFINRGSDVALAILERPITNVEPLATGPLPLGSIGEGFIGIGYGSRNNNSDSGLRYGGQMNLQGVGGNHAINVWGSFERYVQEFPNLGLSISPEAFLPVLNLIPEYEASFGNAPGNAQACFGDSGGPILRSEGGQLVVYGVTSGGLGSNRLICDWGAVYAMLAPAALDLVERTLGCGSVPAAGQCVGTSSISGEVPTIVERCAPPIEGGWRTVQTDCSLFGLVCGEDPTGDVTCISDPCQDLPPEGECQGDIAVRCSQPDEGPRRQIETDCSLIGEVCSQELGMVTCTSTTTFSCQGFCDTFVPDQTGSPACWCDGACRDALDCCEDVESWCPVTSTTAGGFRRR